MSAPVWFQRYAMHSASLLFFADGPARPAAMTADDLRELARQAVDMANRLDKGELSFLLEGQAESRVFEAKREVRIAELQRLLGVTPDAPESGLAADLPNVRLQRRM